MSPMFRDRMEAGQKLAKALTDYAGMEDGLVLALPRGGVPVAFEVAKALSLPLDIWLVRKLGVPGYEELAMGAIAAGGALYINRNVVDEYGIEKNQIDEEIEKESGELRRRAALYRGDRPPLSVRGKTVLVVDDGLATGATMRAAVESLRHAQAAKIVVAVPVGSAEACSELTEMADKGVCLHTPSPFFGVGQWYMDFTQVSDEDVRKILSRPDIF